MANTDYDSLYRSLLKGEVKRSNGDWNKGLCPFHDDHNPSFHYHTKEGHFICFACDTKGDAPQFAKDMGQSDWHTYISNSNNHNHTKYSVLSDNISSDTSIIDISKKVQNAPKKATKVNMDEVITYHMNLGQKWDDLEYKDVWNKEVVQDLSVGYSDDHHLYYAYHNEDGKIIALKKHRGHSVGDTSVKWYLRHRVCTYDKNKPLYICEGEKDALVLLSLGFQVITTSNGASSIPYNLDENGNKIYDLDFLSGWKKVIMIYDNDKSGRNGMDKMGQEILNIHRDLNLWESEWRKGLKDGYDVYDAFVDDNKGAEEFQNALESLKRVEYRQKDTNNESIHQPKPIGFNVLNIEDYMSKEYEAVEYLVQDLIDEKGIALFGGDTGSGKSWMGLQTALSIASGTKLFDAFDVKQSKVLLVQFENNDFSQQKRLKRMIPHFDNFHQWKKNFDIAELKVDNDVFIDNWANVEKTIIEKGFRNGVLIVDNMYTSTDLNIQENDKLKMFLQFVNRMRRKFNITILLICHTNKTDNNGTQKSLHYDQLQGGKTLINFVDNCCMIHPSSQNPTLRFAKIVKAGRVDENQLYNIPFKMHWDTEKCLFSKGVIIPNEALHFLPPKQRFEDKLIVEAVMGTELEHRDWFDRQMFINSISEEYIKQYEHPNQITRLLKTLEKYGYIKSIAHNKYIVDLVAVKELQDRIISESKR